MLADAMLNPHDPYESPINCLSRLPAGMVRSHALHYALVQYCTMH
jgi:hypothetical protein